MSPFEIAGIIFGLFDRFLPDNTRADFDDVMARYGQLLDGLDPLVLRAVEEKWQRRMESRAADPRLAENSDLDERRRRAWLLRRKDERSE